MTKDEALKKAFKQAFQLGQDYWYQADHEYESQNKKSDVTRAKFEQLMEDAIKEALAQPEQKPVAWMTEDECEVYTSKQVDGCFQHDHIPLYTTPPQRTWVGLTPQERDEINEQVYGAAPHHVVFHAAIEAKLKENI